MLYVESEHPVTGLDTAISPGITTPVPGRVSNAGKRQEPRNTRTFQAVGAVTKSVGELDNVRYVRREIGVAKFPQRLHRWQVLLAHLYNQGDSAVAVAVPTRSAPAGLVTLQRRARFWV